MGLTMASANELMLPHLKNCEAASYGANIAIKPAVRLNLNEYQYDLSPKVIQTLKDHAHLAKQYVYVGDEPTAELQQNIADYCGVEKENIAMDEALDQAFNRLPRVFVDKGENIVYMAPTYPELVLGTLRAGGAEKKVPMQAPDLAMDAEKIISAVDKKTKLVFVCTPNNPTSAKMKRDDVLKIVENARHSIVVVDECYYEYCGETVSDVINEYENLCIARSFSKGFGLAGARMAYFIAPKETCEAYGRVMNGFEFNRFGVFSSIASLGDIGYYQNVWKTIAAEKARMAKAFRALKFRVWDSASSFTFMDISASGKTSTEIRNMFLEKYKILIRDVNATFPELEKKYVSFGTAKPEVNDKLMEGFKDAVSE